jgi:hypothetical protein
MLLFASLGMVGPKKSVITFDRLIRFGQMIARFDGLNMSEIYTVKNFHFGDFDQISSSHWDNTVNQETLFGPKRLNLGQKRSNLSSKNRISNEKPNFGRRSPSLTETAEIKPKGPT